MRALLVVGLALVAFSGDGSADYVTWATVDEQGPAELLTIRTYAMQEEPPAPGDAALSWSAGPLAYDTGFVHVVGSERHVGGGLVVHLVLMCDSPVAFDPLFGSAYVTAWWPGTSLYENQMLPPVCDGRVDLAVPFVQEPTRLLSDDPVQVAIRIPAPNVIAEGMVHLVVGPEGTRVEMEEQALAFDRPVVLVHDFDGYDMSSGRLFTDAPAVRLAWNGTLGGSRADVRVVDLGTGDMVHHAELGGHASTLDTAGEVQFAAGPGTRLELRVSEYRSTEAAEHMEFLLEPLLEAVDESVPQEAEAAPAPTLPLVVAGLAAVAWLRPRPA